MPRFDGTGPRGEGPMSGRGEGYCAIKLPEPGQAPEGYVGVEGTPVRLDTPATWLSLWPRFARWLRLATWFGGTFRRAGRGRGPRVGRW
jgi:hypothetical protein